MGFSGRDPCKSCLPLIWCFSLPFFSNWFPNTTFLISLLQIQWRGAAGYSTDSCPSWQTIYEISWVVKEAFFNRMVLKRSWKVYLILSTDTHPSKAATQRKPLKWVYPYGSPVRNTNMAIWSRWKFQTTVSSAVKTPISWAREEENNGSKMAKYNRPNAGGCEKPRPMPCSPQGCSINVRAHCIYLSRMNKIKRACWCWMLRQCLRHPWLTACKLGLVLQVQSLFR